MTTKTPLSLRRTLLAAATALTAACLPLPVAQAQDSQFAGIKYTVLLPTHDLSAAGREVSQVLVGFGPGVVAPRHSHPGEELVHVVEGTLEYDLDGQPPMILKTGDSFLIPYGTIHGVKNVGSSNATELATYIVEKGKPLITPAK
jgi:quercetin dioxygenase-like cupin family protein